MSGGPLVESVNPATEQVLARFPQHSSSDVDAALDSATVAFAGWRDRPLDERAARLHGLARVLRQGHEHYARLITLEMGKPITESLAEVEKCAWTCDFYAEHGEQFLREHVVETNAKESFVAFEPLGTLLAIMPWNFPFWQVIRFLAPALMAGNSVLLKHASNVPQCALAIQDAVRSAGFPTGLFQALLVSGDATERIITDHRVRGVTLTGSSATGARVAGLAARALKKTVLELGGSDPFIVLRDADIEAAVRTGVRARTQNAGQSCIAAKRFLVEADVAAEFERGFVEAVASLRVGDPLDVRTQVGPLARPDIRETLTSQVTDSLRAGARVAVGGEPCVGRGWFFQPTLLADVTANMRVFVEETFGPVAALVIVHDADEAVEVANASPFGLGAAVWTRDSALGRRVARSVESGCVFVNGMVASDPRLPFGGVKASGYGRELSEFGIREFVNIKSVWIGHDAPG